MVPFLVLLPLVESNQLEGQDTMSLVYQLGPTAFKTIGSLAALLVAGRLIMRRLFRLVAESRSDETFISLCLLTVTGAGLLTQKLGLSDTLGEGLLVPMYPWCSVLSQSALAQCLPPSLGLACSPRSFGAVTAWFRTSGNNANVGQAGG